MSFIGKPDTIFNPVGGSRGGEIGVTGILQQLLSGLITRRAAGARFPIRFDKLILPDAGLERATADDV